MGLKGKLNRLKKHITKPEEPLGGHEVTTERSLVTPTNAVEVPYSDSWAQLQSSPFYFENGYSIVRELTYPLDYRHGMHRFSELYEVMEMWEQRGIQHPLTFSQDAPSNMIFFDTETTGLGGGVGNTIFLIGYARVYKDHVKVKQHFLPSPSSEVALYQGFLTDIGNYEEMKLTTYNGKSFDWPQIKTRHTLVRDAVPKLPAFGHFDLLHAARRLWKNQLPSVRLSIVEKEILDVQRNGDVPGALAPLLYFDFLKDADPKIVEGVLTHNEIDVLSLITLYIHISKKILKDTTIKINQDEQFEIARWFESIGDIKTATNYYQQVTVGDRGLAKKAQKALGLLLKKQKNYHDATILFEKLISIEKMADIDVAIELSKLYEHQWRDYEKALYFAELGYATWGEQNRLIRKANAKEKEQFKKRLERLKRKCTS